MNKFLLSACLSLAVISGCSAGVPLDEFFPYGQAEGDALVPTADDNFVQHVLTSPHKVYFFDEGYDTLYVNNNGGVSFIRGVSAYTPTCGPQATPMIVPFWADVDTRNGGYVWYRESGDAAILAKATREIRAGFPELPGSFNVTRVFIVTWDEVAFYGANGCGSDALAKRNNFQSVVSLGNEGQQSFIIFNYEKVEWITGTASGGNCQGRGGTPAKAGFDTGDSVNFYSLPGTCTEQVDRIVNLTNVNKEGRWIFRIDENEIVEPTQAPTTEPTTEPITEPTTEEPPIPTTTQAPTTRPWNLCPEDDPMEPPHDDCPDHEDIPTYLPYPYDCTKYFQCSNGVAICMRCANGTVWDQAQTVCAREADVGCVIVTTTVNSTFGLPKEEGVIDLFKKFF